VVWAYA